MRVAPGIILLLFTLGCSVEAPQEPPETADGTSASQTETTDGDDTNTNGSENASDVTETAGVATNVDQSPPGTEPDRCGEPAPGLEPIDCTAGGDTQSACVYGNHCLCSEGFVCDGPSLLGDNDYECAPGISCVPAKETDNVGHEADSCGAPYQELEPIDCTAGGDTQSVCVYGNHCLCSEGFVCNGPSLFGNNDYECAPGVSCAEETVPGIIGAEPNSCGAPSQSLEPIDCTEGGDLDAVCVFSNHCMCSEGYICDGPVLAGMECEAGVGCVLEQ